jgi:hypothetical protein
MITTLAIYSLICWFFFYFATLLLVLVFGFIYFSHIYVVLNFVRVYPLCARDEFYFHLIFDFSFEKIV